MSITIHSGLKTKILEARGEASKDLKAPAECLRGLETHFERRDDGGLSSVDSIMDFHLLGWCMDIDSWMKTLLLLDIQYIRVRIRETHQDYLQQPDINEWKWEKITRVVNYQTEKLASDLYQSSSVQRHGVPEVAVKSFQTVMVASHSHTYASSSEGIGYKTTHRVRLTIPFKTDWQSRAYISHLPQRAINVSTIHEAMVTGRNVDPVIWIEVGENWDTHLLLVKFSYNNNYHTSIKCAPFEALYGRKCRSPVIWTGVGESQHIGPEIMQETTEKIIQIKERLKAARSRKKSYADRSRKPLEFKVGDRVLLKCLADSDVQVPLEEIEIDENLRFIEEPIEIVERDVKRLKRRRIPLVKVRWNSRKGAEYTWELEDQFRKKYSHLFSKPVPSSSVAT
ncbi:putative reverse transcriptase domain-containing protein [Tanacetum coccineum]